MTAHLTETHHRRLSTSGLPPMSTAHALTLFDAALRVPFPNPITATISTHVRNQHPMLRELTAGRAPAPKPTGDSREDLRERLQRQTPAQQRETLTTLVRGATAAVLGHQAAGIAPGRPFKELGIDSLTAVELRNHLQNLTHLALPTAVVFDHPDPARLAEHLHTRLTGQPADEPPGSVLTTLDQLTARLSATGLDAATRRTAAERLRDLLMLLADQPAEAEVGDRLTGASDDEIFDFIENELEL